MISRSNYVKGAKKSLLPRLFLVEFAAHGANIGVTPKKKAIYVNHPFSAYPKNQ
jgi:hypothetical protein